MFSAHSLAQFGNPAPINLEMSLFIFARLALMCDTMKSTARNGKADLSGYQ